MRTLARIGAWPALALWAALLGAQDPRSVERVRLDCASELTRHDLTLFANGTLRLRQWDEEGELDMLLLDLDPEESEDLLSRLGFLDFNDVESAPSVVPGGWIETCRLRLDLGQDPVTQVMFSRGAALPLAVSQALEMLEGLEGRALAGTDARELPEDYVPRPGDVLLRPNGERYEVLGWTSDGRALELLGIDRPFTIYVLPGGLAEEFVAVVGPGAP